MAYRSMAYQHTFKAKLLLGYDDEEIDDKFEGQVDFTTNKIGGKPDWQPGISDEPQPCPLCQLPRLLVVQIYAPLDNLPVHRNLHVFACINPNCWNQNESWACVRTQSNDKDKVITCKDPFVVRKVLCWLRDADNWGDNNNASAVEKNGNEDEETAAEKLKNLSVDDNNANSGGLAEAQGGAFGCLQSPAATAEIEENEGEIISIDTPTFPQNDIIAMLQEVASLPQEFCQITKKVELEFAPVFMNVCEKTYLTNEKQVEMYEKELPGFYRIQIDCKRFSGYVFNKEADKICGGEDTQELYEEAVPAHGDKMFHEFSEIIKCDNGHVLRYLKGSKPLLIRPMEDFSGKCSYCQGEMVFEFQILPTLIPVLQLTTDKMEGKSTTRLEFGNVLIYTCDKSCKSMLASPKLESVIVQAET